MEAGVADHVWEIEEIISLANRKEPKSRSHTI